MSRVRLFHLKNEMLVANLLANLIGVWVIEKVHRVESPGLMEIHPGISVFDTVFTIVVFSAITLITVLYEKPIRRCLTLLVEKGAPPPALMATARRRVLNEPFVMLGMDLGAWLLGAVLYPWVFWLSGAGDDVIRRSVVLSLSNGLITVTVAFFLLEHVLQKKLVPSLFPGGGLSSVPGATRIRIRTRLFALLLAANLIPLFVIFEIVERAAGAGADPAAAMAQLHAAISINVLLFAVIGTLLTLMVSRNLTSPFREIIGVLSHIKGGRFDRKVRVTSNDEIGYTGDVINEMTEGLMERERLQYSLMLAREVQQNLLPKEGMRMDGIDIAGRSVYCDETGGDYFDFIAMGKGNGRRIGVAVGDVAGHGIPSALLMASVRASLRQRSLQPGSPAGIISDVNRLLAHDVEESGQFMTLFYLVIDPKLRCGTWVRAGHDPALLYDPCADRFEILEGAGIALGVDGEWGFQEHAIDALCRGQVIFMGTDGLWEARNRKGEMFGKGPVRRIIRRHSDLGAKAICDRILEKLTDFQGGARVEDDITLVVIKIDQ